MQGLAGTERRRYLAGFADRALVEDRRKTGTDGTVNPEDCARRICGDGADFASAGHAGRPLQAVLRRRRSEIYRAVAPVLSRRVCCTAGDHGAPRLSFAGLPQHRLSMSRPCPCVSWGAPNAAST